jgi:hypothetical protein
MGLPKIAEEEVTGCPDRKNKTKRRRREEELKKPRSKTNLEKGDGVGGRKREREREDSGKLSLKVLWLYIITKIDIAKYKRIYNLKHYFYIKNKIKLYPKLKFNIRL